jgi:sorbitol/mannitol transport system permease protein
MAAIASTRRKATLLLAPSVTVLILWTFVPLAATIYFSTLRYNLMNPARRGFAGLNNYIYLVNDPAFWDAIQNTLILVGSVLAITVVLGTLIALLLDQPFPGRGIVRVLVIAPFFVMPTVSALVWKNLLLHPVSGVLTWVARSVGLQPIDWLSQAPLAAIIIMVAWQWLPFAILILLTALQSLDHEQREAARIDGAGPIASFRYVTLPLLRPTSFFVLLVSTVAAVAGAQTFDLVYVMTKGGPANSTSLAIYYIYEQAFQFGEYGYAAAMASVLVVILLAFTALLFRATRGGRFDYD